MSPLNPLSRDPRETILSSIPAIESIDFLSFTPQPSLLGTVTTLYRVFLQKYRRENCKLTPSILQFRSFEPFCTISYLRNLHILLVCSVKKPIRLFPLHTP